MVGPYTAWIDVGRALTARLARRKAAPYDRPRDVALRDAA
jgi:hypothetical protein